MVAKRAAGSTSTQTKQYRTHKKIKLSIIQYWFGDFESLISDQNVLMSIFSITGVHYFYMLIVLTERYYLNLTILVNIDIN